MTLEQLEKEVQKIQLRNKKVEADKAWETSIFRRVLIAVLTYIVISLFFIAADVAKPLQNAIVPTIGFLLSTLSLGIFKKFWLTRQK